MSYILFSLFLLFGSITTTVGESSSVFDRISKRLTGFAKRLSLVSFIQIPDTDSYLNYDLTKNAAHKLNFNDELTKIIREWSPRLLALDPACPYYFSKLNNPSIPEEDLNLFSYLKAGN